MSRAAAKRSAGTPAPRRPPCRCPRRPPVRAESNGEGTPEPRALAKAARTAASVAYPSRPGPPARKPRDQSGRDRQPRCLGEGADAAQDPIRHEDGFERRVGERDGNGRPAVASRSQMRRASPDQPAEERGAACVVEVRREKHPDVIEGGRKPRRRVACRRGHASQPRRIGVPARQSCWRRDRRRPHTTFGAVVLFDQLRYRERCPPVKKPSSLTGAKWPAIGDAFDLSGSWIVSPVAPPPSAGGTARSVLGAGKPSPARAAATRNSGDPSSAASVHPADRIGGGFKLSRALALLVSQSTNPPSAISALRAPSAARLGSVIRNSASSS